MTLYVLQISDTHLCDSPDAEIAPGVSPWPRVRALIARIREWIEKDQVPIDWIIHTGDLVHRGHLATSHETSTRLGLELFQSIPKPIGWVVGNHDHRPAIRKWVGNRPGHALTNEPDRWCYHWVDKGERIVVLDARGPLDLDPQGELSQEQLDKFSSLLATTSEPVSVFMHYPPIPLGCDWIDRTMLVRNGAMLHEILKTHRERIRGVFFGHIHRPMSVLQDGILYAACGSSTMHFPTWPNASSALTTNDKVAFAQLIEIGPQGVRVKPQWLELPRQEQSS